MKTASIYEAKNNLSQLVNNAQNGEVVVILKRGKPVVTMTKYQDENASLPRVGFLRGKIHMTEDFDAVQEEVIAMFEGKYSEDSI